MRDITGVVAALLFGIGANPLVSQTASADSLHGGALAEETDLKQIPTVWRNLANESMMYPMKMGDIAAKIGPEHQLFVDNCLLAEATNVTREVHQPVRYERNPVLTPNREFFREGYLWMVRQFDESPRFRIWYQAFDQWHDNPIGKKLRFMIGYATSEDGMNWVKPNVGIFEIEGSKKNHIVIHEGSMHGLFYEPWEPDPQKRFKAFVCVEGWKQIVPEGYYLYTSPDGIHWKGDLSHKIMQSAQKYTFPLHGVGDTSRFWWDPIRKKYRGDIKFILPGKIRCRGGMMESDDLIHWSRAQPTFYALDGDKQIYHHIPFVYQGMYLGFRWIFHPQYAARTGPKKFPGHVMHVELDCSRDGYRWTRVGTGQPLMALNHKRDTWDCLMLKPVEPLIVGDEIWIYYTSLNAQADPALPAYPAEEYLRSNCVGLAKLRLDGFVSLGAGEEPGIVRTRPLGFKGKTLHLNAEVAEGGEVRVALVSRDGSQYIKGYTADDCTPVTGDGIDKLVSWKGGADIGGLSGSGTRIEFKLRKAKLYSFWIE